MSPKHGVEIPTVRDILGEMCGLLKSIRNLCCGVCRESNRPILNKLLPLTVRKMNTREQFKLRLKNCLLERAYTCRKRIWELRFKGRYINAGFDLI